MSHSLSDKTKKEVEPAKQALTPEQHEELIRLNAYYLWELKGKKFGADKEDWSETEDYLFDDLKD